MATDTQSRLETARARYQAAKAKEDALYQAYTSLPLTAHPLTVDAARTAYLRAANVTLGLLCEVARLQAGA